MIGLHPIETEADLLFTNDALYLARCSLRYSIAPCYANELRSLPDYGAHRITRIGYSGRCGVIGLSRVPVCLFHFGCVAKLRIILPYQHGSGHVAFKTLRAIVVYEDRNLLPWPRPRSGLSMWLRRAAASCHGRAPDSPACGRGS
jgi:hypothetical protein